MYQISISIQGVTSYLHHKYIIGDAPKKVGGKEAYQYEWLYTMYARNGLLYVPAVQIKAALVKAGKQFQREGRGRARWTEEFKSTLYVQPQEIYVSFRGQSLKAPDETLLERPTEALCVNIVPVRNPSTRGTVARSRLEMATGWEAKFKIQVAADEPDADVVYKALEYAGRFCGVGDRRPEYGQFRVAEFEVNK